MGDVLSLLGVIVAVIAILALSYWCTKLIARRGIPGFANPRSREEICVLRQINVGRGERLLLVRLHERYLLLGVTGGGITLLTELTEEEASVWSYKSEQNGGTPPSFLDALRSNLTKKK